MRRRRCAAFAAAASPRAAGLCRPLSRKTKQQPNPTTTLTTTNLSFKKTAAGILLPKGPPKPNSDAHFGTVMAVGEDVKIEVKAGQTVVFNKYAMAEVELSDGEVLFVSEKSVLGVAE